MIDTHIHGAFGFDISDGISDDIISLARKLKSKGIDAFCPTTMTMPVYRIFKAFEAVSIAKDKLNKELDSDILGINLEGPFLSSDYSGVQNSSDLLSPDEGFKLIESLEQEFPDLLLIINIAPELPGAIDFIKEYKDRYSISLAHTNCDYDIAMEAFDSGANSVTHTLNAMKDTTKRNPGVLGAAFDSNAYTEFISDGIHISPTVLKMMFKTINQDRIIVISDSMRGTYMPEGTYKLGEANVLVKDGRTYYGPTGGLAGSVVLLPDQLDRLRSYGISEDTIIKSTTINPLRRLKKIDKGYML